MSIFAPVITTLAGALAIIAVFIAGLLLDLFASFFAQMEMRTFRKHLDSNHSWITPVVSRHAVYCLKDYQLLREKVGKDSLLWDFTEGMTALLRTGVGAPPSEPYERLVSFFSSYVAIVGGSSQQGILTDQYYLWRTARSISVALIIVFFEGLFIVAPSSELLSLIMAFLPLVVFVVALAITRATFSRLCYTLFALVYVCWETSASSAQGGAASIPGQAKPES